MQYTKTEYALAILALEQQFRQPTLDYKEGGTNLGLTEEIKATDARGRLDSAISVDHQEGQGPYLPYITANDLEQILGVSHDTAYRWLKRFEKNDVLFEKISGDKLGYKINHKYCSIVDSSRGSEEYKRPEDIVKTARDFMEAVENA